MAVPKRILIVDDDRDVHGLLRYALAAPDRKIESAYDGPTGLRLVEESPYDVVLTSLELPGLDGMTLLERIQAWGKTRSHTAHLQIRRFGEIGVLSPKALAAK